MKHYRLKNDRFLKMKGGTSKVLEICCERCKASVLIYQKDGIGSLKRCYLDRILDPSTLSSLHSDPRITGPKSIPPLKCAQCGEILGIPSRHHSGRLAFHLLPGKFRRHIWRADADRRSAVADNCTETAESAPLGSPLG